MSDKEGCTSAVKVSKQKRAPRGKTPVNQKKEIIKHIRAMLRTYFDEPGFIAIEKLEAVKNLLEAHGSDPPVLECSESGVIAQPTKPRKSKSASPSR